MKLGLASAVPLGGGSHPWGDRWLNFSGHGAMRHEGRKTSTHNERSETERGRRTTLPETNPRGACSSPCGCSRRSRFKGLVPLPWWEGLSTRPPSWHKRGNPTIGRTHAYRCSRIDPG